MALPIVNPLHHTWAISAPPTGPNGYFGPKQPSWQGEDHSVIFELAENQSKSGKCLIPKVIPSFLGDVGLIKEVSEFFFSGTRIAIFLYPKMVTFGKSAHL